MIAVFIFICTVRECTPPHKLSKHTQQGLMRARKIKNTRVDSLVIHDLVFYYLLTRYFYYYVYARTRHVRVIVRVLEKHFQNFQRKIQIGTVFEIENCELHVCNTVSSTVKTGTYQQVPGTNQAPPVETAVLLWGSKLLVATTLATRMIKLRCYRFVQVPFLHILPNPHRNFCVLLLE